MTKNEEREKLQELKSNGTITAEEFEVEEQKTLNTKTNTVKKDKKKKGKAIKIIVSIILVIAVIVCGIIIKNIMEPKILISQTEKKVSQIDAEELQNKLISELENSSLNVNTSLISTTFDIYDKNDKNSNWIVAMSILEGFNGYRYGRSEDIFDGFVFVKIEEKSKNNAFYYPCFKITSNDIGKIKNIEYVCNDAYNISDIIENTINNVLKEQYNINKPLANVSDMKYGYNYPSRFNQASFFVSANDFGTDIISKVTGETDKSYIKTKLQKDNGWHVSIFSWNVD